LQKELNNINEIPMIKDLLTSTTQQETHDKEQYKKERKVKLGLTSREDFLEWWTQGLTLGLIRYDGKILERPDVKRFGDWWVHGFTLGIITVQQPNIVEKGNNILDHIARMLSLSLVTTGGTPTTLAKKHEKGSAHRRGWPNDNERHAEAALKGKRR
jgi:hypothetical protein